MVSVLLCCISASAWCAATRLASARVDGCCSDAERDLGPIVEDAGFVARVGLETALLVSSESVASSASPRTPEGSTA